MTLVHPEREPLDAEWAAQHAELHARVKEALVSLPAYFRSETSIAGMPATDIHALNSALGAAIEEQMVRALNTMRSIWDPDDAYVGYYFVRQSQTLPDVLLKSAGVAGRDGILMGIELKGWYLLAKEGEPSLRFCANRNACSAQDLIAVVPWILSNVISGSPIVFPPWIESARYCADMRNYYWRSLDDRKDRTIEVPDDAHPYPAKSEKIADYAPGDGSSGNFGRIARSGIMDDYIEAMFQTDICGIQVTHWFDFFKAFKQNSTPEDVRREISRLAAKLTTNQDSRSDRISAIQTILSGVSSIIAMDD